MIVNRWSKKFKSLLASLVLGLGLFGVGSMTPAYADLIDFEFSFTNSANDDGFVTGIIRGLMDDATSSAASVEVLSNSTGFGVGEYVGSPSDNTWVVAAGMLVEFDFLAFGSSNSSPDVFDSSLRFRFDSSASPLIQAGLTNSSVAVVSNSDVGRAFVPVAQVPTPLPLALVGLGLLVMGLVRKGR